MLLNNNSLEHSQYLQEDVSLDMFLKFYYYVYCVTASKKYKPFNII